ncbi:MAG: TrkA family potassium uptake protein [Acidobacteria bacterium]|nr:TrkA family potassium uptake protein [Acidobacteriota bacterium]
MPNTYQNSKLYLSIQKLLRKLKRHTVAELRLLRILRAEFKISLWILFIELSLGTTLIRYHYPRPNEPIDWPEAFYYTIHAMLGQALLPYPKHSYISYLFIILPVLGVGIITHTIASLGSLIFQRRSQKKEWYILLASTYRDHVVICGLGHVGYRTLQNLLHNNIECVVIEVKETLFVEEIRSLGVPVIIADARRQEALEQANIREAKAIMVVTNDDLANLEIAIDARTIRPDIRVVMRMFDENLARKISKSFNIHCVFSTSAIAAPVFAAAITERNIINSFVFNNVQLNTVEFTVAENSQLLGWTLDQLRSRLELTIALYQSATEMDWNPNPSFVLEPGTKLLIITTANSLHELEKLNKPV